MSAVIPVRGRASPPLQHSGEKANPAEPTETMGRWDHNPQISPTYELLSFFAEGLCFHGLNLIPFHSWAPTSSSQPLHEGYNV